MLVAIVYCHVKAEHVAAFAEACRVNHEGSIREPGVLRFDVLQQQDDPTRFVLYEAYRGQADVDFHKTTAHYAAWRDATADWFEEPRHGVRYDGLAPVEPVA
jgi:autoinducer 2-degrading protein